MLTRNQAEGLCVRALEASEADATEVVVAAKSVSSLRLAESGPSEQNALSDTRVFIRAELGGRQGRAEVSSADDEAIKAAVQQALAAARVAPPLDLPELSGPSQGPDGGHDETELDEVGAHSQDAKLTQLAPFLDRVRARSSVATGFYETQVCSTSYATSAGCFRHGAVARSWFSTTVLHDDGAGVAHVGAYGRGLRDAELAAAGDRAHDKALASRQPVDIDPGEYRVLLEPQAVGDLLLFVSAAGLGARAFLDGASFLSAKLGERVIAGELSLRDDASHRGFRALGFDLEGQTRRSVDLVQNGVAQGPVWDRVTAAEARASGAAAGALEAAADIETTGHAALQPSSFGPEPSCLLLEPGQGIALHTREGLLAELGTGLLVTQFHYVNLIDPLPVMITGMTRNGTFWVEDGKVKGPVRNLRFTQSAIAALDEVVAVGDDAQLVEAFFGGSMRTPSLVLPRFSFTSSTEF